MDITKIPGPQCLITHVIIVRFADSDSNRDRRTALYAYGEDNARSLADTIERFGEITAVSDTVPYLGALRKYQVLRVEWAPL